MSRVGRQQQGSGFKMAGPQVRGQFDSSWGVETKWCIFRGGRYDDRVQVSPTKMVGLGLTSITENTNTRADSRVKKFA